MTSSRPGNGGGAGADAASATTRPFVPDPASDLQRLKHLLLERELGELDVAHARLREIERLQRALAQRLPAALEAVGAGEESARIARALSVPVAQALGAAVRDNRQTIIDALFPVIGPLIRKAIAEALRNLVGDLNGAIESGFSVRGLAWRIEAWRGGVPYAQVVLRHRLTYRVDHVFVIERASGLVIAHTRAPDLAAIDADAIAGMLTALGDFVGDSVGTEGGSALDSAQVGEYLVWVVQGPRANLACFMRGVPPPGLRGLLEARLEEIHAGLGLIAASDDPRSALQSPSWQAALQPLSLQRDAGEEGSIGARSLRPSRWPLFLIVAAILVTTAWWIARGVAWDRQVDRLRATLRSTPGLVVTAIDSEPWRSLTVHALVDPDAGSLASLLAGAPLGSAQRKIDATGYLSTDDAIIERRARRLLGPPHEVGVRVVDGVLRLDGRATQSWIGAARERAPWIGGVRRVDDALVADADPIAVARAGIKAIAQSLKSEQVQFSADAEPASADAAILDIILAAAGRAQALAATAQVRLRFTSIGASDETGSDEVNLRVRMARARWLGDALAARGFRAGKDAAVANGDDPSIKRRSAYLRIDSEALSP